MVEVSVWIVACLCVPEHPVVMGAPRPSHVAASNQPVIIADNDTTQGVTMLPTAAVRRVHRLWAKGQWKRVPSMTQTQFGRPDVSPMRLDIAFLSPVLGQDMHLSQ